MGAYAYRVLCLPNFNQPVGCSKDRVCVNLVCQKIRLGFLNVRFGKLVTFIQYVPLSEDQRTLSYFVR
jgi:hypothetical protein